MNIIDEIKTTELYFRKLKHSLEITGKTSVRNKIEDDLKKLSFNQDTAVMNYLLENDKVYFKISERNFELMKNDNIEIKVTREDWGFLQSHATKLEGSVRDNGFFYGSSTETDLAIFGFQKGYYPKEYKGTINYLGEAEIRNTKKGWSIGGRVPERYLGSIDDRGRIVLTIVDSHMEFHGITCIKSIVGDLFSGDGEKREQFIENKDKLFLMVSDFRSNL